MDAIELLPPQRHDVQQQPSGSGGKLRRCKLGAIIVVSFCLGGLVVYCRDLMQAPVTQAPVEVEPSHSFRNRGRRQTRHSFSMPAGSYTPHTIHVIGDTHGDENFLIRALHSTDRFKVVASKKKIEWKDDLDDDFSIYVLGDFFDRGDHAIQNVKTLKRLSEERSNLKVLLGNHDTMLLKGMGMDKWANPKVSDGGLNQDGLDVGYKNAKVDADVEWRLNALTGDGGKDVVDWLASLPIVAVERKVLFVHGGVCKKHMDLIFKEPDIEGYTVEHFVSFVNSKAKAYFNYMLRCYRGQEEPVSACPRTAGNAGSKDITDPKKLMYLRSGTDDLNLNNASSPFKAKSDRLKVCSPKCEPPFFMNDRRESGLLWFRAYTRGDLSSCLEAGYVAARLQLNGMSIAHSTQKYISKFCPGITQKPVYATDVHYEKCLQGSQKVEDPHRESDEYDAFNCAFVRGDFRYKARKEANFHLPSSLMLSFGPDSDKPEERVCYSNLHATDGDEDATRCVEWTSVNRGLPKKQK